MLCYTWMIMMEERTLMTSSSTQDQDTDLVQCIQCSHVWLRKDRLEQHMRKVHSPTAAPRKSFTTYTANLASTFPPRISSASKPGNVQLTTRAGKRVGKGFCAECGCEEKILWHYSESNLGPVEICSSCKSKVFERSFGEKNA